MLGGPLTFVFLLEMGTQEHGTLLISANRSAARWARGWVHVQGEG